MTSPAKKKSLIFIIIFVNLAIPLGGMSTDIFLPSLPAMTQFFASSNFLIQLTITFFTLGLGLGQLIIGPISDSQGRRKPLLFGLLLQIAMTLVIITVHSIISLEIARFFQGLGTACMVVPARAMLADTFEGGMLKRQFTYITASFAIGPIVAPFIGGYLQHAFGWQANFIFILIFLAMVLCLFFAVIPETSTQRHNLSLRNIRNSYANVLVRPFFVVSVILASSSIGYTSTFNVIGPFLIQETLHHSAVYYGYVALLAGMCWFLGNMTNRCLEAIAWKTKIHYAMPLMIINGMAFILLSFLPLNIMTFLLPIFIMIYLAGLMFPILVSETLALFKNNAASANGIMFALTWIVFSVFTFIGSQVNSNDSFPIACIYLSIAGASYLWFLFGFRHHQ